MKYHEFENRIYKSLKDETEEFDANQFMLDIKKRKKNRSVLIWFWPIGFILAITLTAFNYDGFYTFSQNNTIDNSDLNTIRIMDAEYMISDLTEDETAFDLQILNENMSKKNIKNEGFMIENQEPDINVHYDVLKNQQHDFEDEVISYNQTKVQSKNQSLDQSVNQSLNHNIDALVPVVELDKTSTLPLKLEQGNILFESYFNNKIGCPDFSNPDKSAGLEVIVDAGVFHTIKELTNISGESNALTRLYFWWSKLL